MRVPVVLSWSGGKDSALALAALQNDDRYEVVALLTTFTRDFERVSMHGVRRELILEQARQLRLPLAESWIDHRAGNSAYEAAFSKSLDEFQQQGVQTVAFGDLFLEDIKAYRERLVTRIGMQSLYPLWGRETTQLAGEFVNQGFRAVTCCVDTGLLTEEFCGRRVDEDFLDSLPPGVDPCGENGEFHTFVFDSPAMKSSVPIELHETYRDGQFVFTEIAFAAPCLTAEGLSQ